MAYKRLGDLLLDAGLISDEQLKQALAMQKGSNRRLGDLLIHEGFITEAGLIEALQMQLGIEFVDLSTYNIPPEMSRVV
ncbi:MAG: type II secretion system protein GspE, partial [Raoultibacter sp.]